MKSLIPVLVLGLLLIGLVFAARCSQQAMHRYETRAAAGSASPDDGGGNSLPGALAEKERLAIQFPDTLPSSNGMRIRIDRAGAGGKPVAGNRVRFHYTAHLLDGTEVGSSRQLDQPAAFAVLKSETPQGLPGPVRGLDMNLLDMRPGEKRLIVLPSRLAFGSAGRPPQVPPRAPLVLEVELVAIE